MSEFVGDPWVSVVLVCYNSHDWLPKCLESLRAQTIFAHSETIIVDNASSDGSEERARELTKGWPKVQIVQTGKNEGFCANNRGAEIARGKYLYLVNPDTWLEPDCLQRLYETAERERAAVVGSTIFEYEDNTLQAEGGTGFDFCGNWVTATGKHRPNGLICPSNFFFVRRDVFMRVGMLDEEYFMYGEEMDLAWRIWISGERIVPGRDARIHHRGAASANPAGGTRIIENRTTIQKRYYTNRNHLLFIATNCRNFLILMIIPSALLVLLEGLAIWLASRNWGLAKNASLGAFAGFWRLRGHIWKQRRRVASFRRHGDLWMMRFFSFRFGRWDEFAGILKRGFPKIK